MDIIQELHTSNESALITQAAQGSDAAFGLLVERYMDVVYGLSLRYMGTQTDAEDATQEAFVKIWKNVRTYNPNLSFKNWILEITKNTCLDQLKKKQVIPFTSFENADGTNTLTDNLVDFHLLPDRLTDQVLLKNLLTNTRRILSEKYNQVLDLYYEEGLNFREIAEYLHTPLHTVKSRHRRSLILLKNLLNQRTENYH